MIPLKRAFDEKRRLIIPVAAGLALNVILFVGVVYPLKARVQSTEQREQAAITGLMAAQREDQSARGLVQGKSQTDTALHSFYKEVLQSLLPDATIIIESDAFIASIGAIGIDPGVLLIAGTGSIVIGRDKDRSMFRVGGWGPYFGDEGSGFWIGREAVRAALRSKDSQGPTEFADRVAQSLGLKSIAEIVAAWATGKVGVPEIAGLFPDVISTYPAEPANRILDEAASHLRSLVEVASKRVGLDDCRKSLSGSVAAHPIMRQLIGLTFEEPRHSPEWGAVIWARQHFANPL